MRFRIYHYERAGKVIQFQSQSSTAFYCICAGDFALFGSLPHSHPSGRFGRFGNSGSQPGFADRVGALFAIPAALSAFLWIKWQTRNDTFEETENPFSEIRNDEQLPTIRLSLLPIVTPLLLIATGSLLTILNISNVNFALKGLAFIGQPIVALMIGVLLSLLLLKNRAIKNINAVLGSAIEKAGPILIVTGAGGMYGLVIKETGIGAYAGEFLLQTGLGLAVPFLIASILKTAQGSSTVAIITAASFVVPMLPALGLDSESGKLLAMISMGAGSMMVSHANDSYFWVVSQFSGINSNTALKVYSSATVVMGIVTFLCVWLTSFFML